MPSSSAPAVCSSDPDGETARAARRRIRVCAAVLLTVAAQPLMAGRCVVRIMPLGDSITKGDGSVLLDGYRKKLYEDLTARFGAEWIRVNMVGSQEGGPPDFDNDHEGHGGFLTEGGREGGILPNLYDWLDQSSADLILLHIGTNDLSGGRQHPAKLYRILDEIDRWDPKAEVVLARIINRVPGNETTTDYNRQIVDMLEEYRTGDRVAVVDQELALDYTRDLADSIHPNDRGYAKMADVWYAAAERSVAQLCSGRPKFRSRPSTTAVIGQPYRYRAHALGEPPLRYRLVEAPPGMRIRAHTGLITWRPRHSGSERVTVEARNGRRAARQRFFVNTFDQIVDNGTRGTRAAGSWSSSVVARPYGSNALVSNSVGDSHTWRASVFGRQEVSLWWTADPTRLAKVPYEIYDGATLLDTVQVDQRFRGGKWNPIGTYDFSSGTAKVAVRAVSDLRTTSADAVRFTAVGVRYPPTILSRPPRVAYPRQPYTYAVVAEGRPRPVYVLVEAPPGMQIDRHSGLITWRPTQLGLYRVAVVAKNTRGITRQQFNLPVTDHIINNGGPGTASLGEWRISNASGPYGLSSLSTKVVNSEYSFSTEASGSQDVYLWWTALPTRATAVPVQIFDGDTLMADLRVDQTQNGGRWNLLGRYTFTSGSARVTVTYPPGSGGRSASADAVWLVALDP